jgi:hypothetical protein
MAQLIVLMLGMVLATTGLSGYILISRKEEWF